MTALFSSAALFNIVLMYNYNKSELFKKRISAYYNVNHGIINHRRLYFPSSGEVWSYTAW